MGLGQHIFSECLKSIEAAGIRTFRDEHLTTLYKDLGHIDDSSFQFITREYIRMEHPPRSLTGHYLTRYHNMKQSTINEKPLGPAYQEYTPKDVYCFFACVNQALRIWVGTSKEYTNWATWFNKKWMDNTKEALTNFLKEHLQKLKETMSVRADKPKMVF